jgi:hypothetical protein
VDLEPVVRQWPEIVGALGGLNVAGRVLGPSLDECGEALQRLTARRLSNVGRVVQKANEKSKAQADNAAPQLRAAVAILHEAMVAEDEVVADYLGGVLASARSDGGDDAVAWTALIARMSSRELRTHYKLYAAIRLAALGHTEINVLDSPGREKLRGFVPYVELIQPFDADEFCKLPEALTGLDREKMFEGNWRFGGVASFTLSDGCDVGPGLEFAPSLNGLNLFVWGNGLATHGLNSFLEDRSLEPLEGINVPRALLRQPLVQEPVMKSDPGTGRGNEAEPT